MRLIQIITSPIFFFSIIHVVTPLDFLLTWEQEEAARRVLISYISAANAEMSKREPIDVLLFRIKTGPTKLDDFSIFSMEVSQTSTEIFVPSRGIMRITQSLYCKTLIFPTNCGPFGITVEYEISFVLRINRATLLSQVNDLKRGPVLIISANLGDSPVDPILLEVSEIVVNTFFGDGTSIEIFDSVNQVGVKVDEDIPGILLSIMGTTTGATNIVSIVTNSDTSPTRAPSSSSTKQLPMNGCDEGSLASKLQQLFPITDGIFSNLSILDEIFTLDGFASTRTSVINESSFEVTSWGILQVELVFAVDVLDEIWANCTLVSVKTPLCPFNNLTSYSYSADVTLEIDLKTSMILRSESYLLSDVKAYPSSGPFDDILFEYVTEFVSFEIEAQVNTLSPSVGPVSPDVIPILICLVTA